MDGTVLVADDDAVLDMLEVFVDEADVVADVVADAVAVDVAELSIVDVKLLDAVEV